MIPDSFKLMPVISTILNLNYMSLHSDSITMIFSHELTSTSGTERNVKMGIKVKCDYLPRNNNTIRFKLTQEQI
jgi:hypothetical protein